MLTNVMIFERNLPYTTKNPSGSTFSDVNGKFLLIRIKTLLEVVIKELKKMCPQKNLTLHFQCSLLLRCVSWIKHRSVLFLFIYVSICFLFIGLCMPLMFHDMDRYVFIRNCTKYCIYQIHFSFTAYRHPGLMESGPTQSLGLIALLQNKMFTRNAKRETINIGKNLKAKKNSTLSSKLSLSTPFPEQ